LLVAVDDASAGQVIRRQLHYNTVLWENADVVLTHLAGNVSKNLVPIIELDTEHCVWQRLDDATLYLNCAFLSHNLYFSGSHFSATTCIFICLLPDAANTRCRVRIHHRHSLRVSCWFSKCMLNASRWSARSEEHTSELQSRFDLVCRLLLLSPRSTLFPYTTLFRSNCAFLSHNLYFSGSHFSATTCIFICLLPDAANTRCRVRIHHRHSLRVSCWFSKCMLNASRWSAPVASVCCLWGLLVPTFGRGAAADPVEIDPVVS